MKDFMEEMRKKLLAEEAELEANKTPEQKAQESEQAKEKLVTARVKMLFNQPFFGNIACRLQLKDVTDEQWCPTAATDGRHFFYNRNFVNNLNTQQCVFLVGHEIGHCIYEHFLRVGDRNKQYWNMAGDYKINGMLVREKIGEIIDQVNICYDEKYNTDEWYTENVYDDLEYLFDSDFFHKQKNKLFDMDEVDEERLLEGDTRNYRKKIIVKNAEYNT